MLHLVPTFYPNYIIAERVHCVVYVSSSRAQLCSGSGGGDDIIAHLLGCLATADQSEWMYVTCIFGISIGSDQWWPSRQRLRLGLEPGRTEARIAWDCDSRPY